MCYRLGCYMSGIKDWYCCPDSVLDYAFIAAVGLDMLYKPILCLGLCEEGKDVQTRWVISGGTHSFYAAAVNTIKQKNRVFFSNKLPCNKYILLCVAPMTDDFYLL